MNAPAADGSPSATDASSTSSELSRITRDSRRGLRTSGYPPCRVAARRFQDLPRALIPSLALPRQHPIPDPAEPRRAKRCPLGLGQSAPPAAVLGRLASALSRLRLVYGPGVQELGEAEAAVRSVFLNGFLEPNPCHGANRDRTGGLPACKATQPIRRTRPISRALRGVRVHWPRRGRAGLAAIRLGLG